MTNIRPLHNREYNRDPTFKDLKKEGVDESLACIRAEIRLSFHTMRIL